MIHLTMLENELLRARLEAINIAMKMHGENAPFLVQKTQSLQTVWIQKSLVISGYRKKVDNNDESVMPNIIKFDLPSTWSF